MKRLHVILNRILLVQVFLIFLLSGILLGRVDKKHEVTVTPLPTMSIVPSVTVVPTIIPTITPQPTDSAPTSAGVFQYYMQTNPLWANEVYGGKDTIAEYGCGPTCMAMVISSMTDTSMNPQEACQWSYENGYWFEQQGSIHALIPSMAEAFGLTCKGIIKDADAEGKIKSALENGKYVVALMGKGTFTNSGHFIVFYGITEDDQVLVADPMSEERSNKKWKLSFLVDEAKPWAAADGPFWAIGN